jgi:hypothetical protein
MRPKGTTDVNLWWADLLKKCLEAHIRLAWDKDWASVCGSLPDDFYEISHRTYFQDHFLKLLSDIISQNPDFFDGTEQNISRDTIKRLFDPDYHKDFNSFTKKLISVFLGFDGWPQFKEKYTYLNHNRVSYYYPVAVQPWDILPKKYNNPQRIWIIDDNYNNDVDECESQPIYYDAEIIEPVNPLKRIAIVFSSVIVLLVLFFSVKSFYVPGNSMEIVAKDANQSDSLPQTIYFRYNAKGMLNDSLRIYLGEFQHSKCTMALAQDKGLARMLYTKPFCGFTRIISKNGIVAKRNVIINSVGWQGWIGYSEKGFPRQQSEIMSGNSIIRNGVMQIEKKALTDYHSSTHCFTKFRYIKDLKIDASDCTVEFKLKNNKETGGYEFYDTGVGLFFSNGQKISVYFMKGGASSFGYIQIGARVLDTEHGVITSELGKDFFAWRIVRLEIENRKLTIKLDGQTLFSELECPEIAGTLHGFEVLFRGSGVCDFVKAYNWKRQLVYSEEFTK